MPNQPKTAVRQVVVRVSGPAHLAELVKREIATALSHLGAFDVTSSGEFSNGTGETCDPERLDLLAGVARENVEVYVERGR